MEHLDIRLLGPFEIRSDGQVLRVPGAKVRALLAVLALSCGRTVPPRVLGEALWTDDPPQRLRGSLQTYVGRLRRVLGDHTIATEPTADVLVALDNCEHVVDEARAAALQLLATYPSVRILTTSRVPLGAPGERVYRLPPLAHRTAVDLFTNRARLVNAGFTFDATVHQICRRLDGLPLAIELAAAWSRVLSARQILDRLTPLLHAPHGHQLTMRAALDASYRLLQPPQQQLFGRLAVFADGFDLEALEAVAGHDESLTALAALVDHSLVLTESLPDGRRRFRLLESVRQYAVTVFEDDAAVRERHARHYLTVVLRDDIRLRGPDRAAAVVDLQREEANLLAALSWAREQPTDLALRLSTALGYSEHRGQINEARGRIEEVLDLAPTEPKVLAAACARLGRLAWRQRD